jgi:hypothetical protein
MAFLDDVIAALEASLADKEAARAADDSDADADAPASGFTYAADDLLAALEAAN